MRAPCEFAVVEIADNISEQTRPGGRKTSVNMALMTKFSLRLRYNQLY